MSFAREAARSGLWFAGFRFITQSLSWVITVAIARILVPEDYGLMAMASILTGYVEIFSELGLGAAIIQKKDITNEELSSTFYFSMIIGAILSIVSFSLAYPTAWIFNEPRIIPITQLISVLFIIGALMIVPYNILSRDVKFKEIGIIQLVSVVVASRSMLMMAKAGFGVWTLINGTIIQRCITVTLTFLITKWHPRLHFHFKEAKPLLKFGINIAGSRSLFYLFQKSDRFIVGKMFNAQYLGYYSFAMQLASIPTDKIVSIVNQVSFPVFSRYQEDSARIQEMYLKTTKYISLLLAPLFFGGFFFGDEIILTLLGEKWIPIIFVFKLFCIAQFIISITAINSVIHSSQGRPHWAIYFHLSNTILMPVSIFIAARHGFNALSLPWITIYPLVCMGWTWVTLRKLNISVLKYLQVFITPFFATFFMIAGIWSVKLMLNGISILDSRVILVQNMVLGAILYSIILFLFERKTLIEIWGLRKT